MEEHPDLLARCEDFIRFLARHDDHAKLRALRKDIEALRDRLRAELDDDASERRG